MIYMSHFVFNLPNMLCAVFTVSKRTNFIVDVQMNNTKGIIIKLEKLISFDIVTIKKTKIKLYTFTLSLAIIE